MVRIWDWKTEIFRNQNPWTTGVIGEGTVHHSPTWIPNGRPEIRHFFFHRAKVAVDLDHQKTASRYPLVMSKLLLKMAIEIVSFPMKNGDFP